MSLDSILPEIYTFLDFTNHECRMAKRKNINKVTTHIGGLVPSVHPMPYNVYLPVSEFLKKNPKAIDSLVNYLREEFSNSKYDYKQVDISKSTCQYKKNTFSKKVDLPYVIVNIEL